MAFVSNTMKKIIFREFRIWKPSQKANPTRKA